LIYSTFLGDARAFDAMAIALGASGEMTVAGYTSAVVFAEGVVGAESAVGPTNLQLATHRVFQPPEGGGVFINRIESDSVEPVSVDAVLNSASLAGGPIVPGEWISVRGRGFVPGASILLDGEVLPSLLVSESELQARVPDSIHPGIPSAVSVATQEQSSSS